MTSSAAFIQLQLGDEKQNSSEEDRTASHTQELHSTFITPSKPQRSREVTVLGMGKTGEMSPEKSLDG